MDHIHPVAQGGSDDMENLALACHNCNNRNQDDRFATDPQTGDLVSLYNPRQDRWNAHFRWSSDLLTVLPISAIGQATVARLQLNRSGAVNVRRALLALAEEHPPIHDETDYP